MRVLVVHNRYVERGGEDVAFAQEVDLLRAHGHAVATLVLDNTDLQASGVGARARLFAQAIWSMPLYTALRRHIRDFGPEVVHVHNWLPLVSPSAFYAAWASGVPVVHTLHNYRLVCPAATLYRAGRVCEDCIGRGTWRGVAHACFSTRRTGYHGSRAGSLVVAAVLEAHRRLGTWRRVEAYIAVSRFVRQRVLADGLGLDPSRVHVKGNFVDASGPVREGPGDYALYVGRLAPEKGVRTLVRAWTSADGPGRHGLELKIVGSGPLESELAGLAQAAGAPVTFLGRRPREEIAGLLAGARLAVVPSEWHEPLSIAAVEALAAGVPLLVTPLGGFRELVIDGDTGLHCLPGNPEHLAHRARQLADDLAMNERMGRAARRLYLQRFTPEQNYAQLLDIYRAAQAVRQSSVRSSWVVRAPQRVV